jgi:hypothetical protein
MSTQTKELTKKTIDVSDIEVGDVFSEESHYVFTGVNNNLYDFKHLESGQTIHLDEKYVSELLQTADQYYETITVGLEDKFWTQKQINEALKKGALTDDHGIREGDLKLKGIRSIWSEIHSKRVLAVCFNKKGKELTKKAFEALKQKQIDDTLVLVSSGKVTLEDAFKSIQNTPIVPVEKGEERILRGYKVQFVSVNGFYDVVDMDIPDDEGKGANLRKVNINEIIWLIVDGVKYVVE